MANCVFHLKDTRWGDNPTGVAIHTLCVEINKDEFCMIDYAVCDTAVYKHQWVEEDVAEAVAYCKPILKAMKVKGKVIRGIEFPETKITA